MDSMKEITFNYNESEFKNEKESEKRIAMEIFISELIEKFNYNPETDQVDVTGLFERYVWR